MVNPADHYKERGEALHKYGQYIMSCLPKYVQQLVSQSRGAEQALTVMQILGVER